MTILNDLKYGTETYVDIEELEDKTEDQEKLLHLYKLIQSVNSACDKKPAELRKLLSKHTILEKVEALKLVLESECSTLFSKQTCKTNFKTSIISSLLNVCYEECGCNNKEALFFAAATLNIERLNEIIKQSCLEDVNQTRYSDSVIIFTLKYADVSNGDFLKCFNSLVQAGVDVNKNDASGRFAIDHVAILFKKTKDESTLDTLKQVGKLLIDKGICEPEETLTKDFIQKELRINRTYRFSRLDIKPKLFFWIAKEKIQLFLNYKKIQHFANCDNGENTLLQYAVNKSRNMAPVVNFLLKNGANPNKVTEVNPMTPLEMAARNNYPDIFKMLITWKTTIITDNQFTNFVRWRGHSMKREFFGIMLESDKLDPTFVFKKSGNTPLYYAIRLCHKNAIFKLLKRPDVSLTVPNNVGKCPLDILNPTDLNTYLDSCLVFDTRHFIDFNSTEYTMKFRFRRLTDGNLTEVDVISLVGRYNHLEHLLAHPLIHTFVMLKWFKVKNYFWGILGFQALLFLILSVFFYRFPYSSPSERVVCFCFSLANIVLKSWVFLRQKNVLQELMSFCRTKTTTLHEYGEILLMISLVGSFCLTEFRAFVFIEMAIVFLLTAGYHPKLAHWSVMLQMVFRTFISLLLFFSLLMIAFAAGFHIMFEDHRFFAFLYRSVFMSYFMTIGEINVSEVDFERTSFGGYLLFFLFAMSMSVVIINFWTGVAIRDIDKFEKRSEVNALKNVIAFIAFVEKHIYSVQCLKRILPSPLLFPNVLEETYIVNFYVNKDDQFVYKWDPEALEVQKCVEKRNFPKQINKICFDKIRGHYDKMMNDTNEQKILSKLNKIWKKLDAGTQGRKPVKRGDQKETTP